MRPISAWLDTLIERVKGGDRYISTGFASIDHHIIGLTAGQLIVVSGRPSMGKSIFCFNIAKWVIYNGHRVLIFSLEMTADEVMDSFAGAALKVDTKMLQRPKQYIEMIGIERIKTWVDSLNGKLYIDDTGGHTPATIEAAVSELKPELVVIDNLNLLSGGRSFNSRYEEISYITRELKLIAKRCAVPVVCIAHLNRQCDTRDNKRPLLADFRDSGSVEQDANIIMFVYRRGLYDHSRDKNQPVEIIIAKARGASCGNADLTMDMPCNLFEEVQK